MNSDIEIGQVLWLKVRYQIDVVSTVKHPMLVAKINDNYIEVIAMDKVSDRMYQLLHDYNLYVDSDNPREEVINQDSYAQLNTKITIENVKELKKSRTTIKKLSSNKLNSIIKEYDNYQNKHGVDEQRIVHMDKKEVLSLNEELKED